MAMVSRTASALFWRIQFGVEPLKGVKGGLVGRDAGLLCKSHNFRCCVSHTENEAAAVRVACGVCAIITH
jgi:hypothetical protein